MKGIPANAISYKIVLVVLFTHIFSVQMTRETTSKPPGAMIMLGAVVIETGVVIPVMRAEGLSVVTLPRGGQGIPCVAMVPAHVKPEELVLGSYSEVVVVRMVLNPFPVL